MQKIKGSKQEQGGLPLAPVGKMKRQRGGKNGKIEKRKMYTEERGTKWREFVIKLDLIDLGLQMMFLSLKLIYLNI